MGIMQGKTILVPGVLTDHSIAFSVAKLIQEDGGTALGDRADIDAKHVEGGSVLTEFAGEGWADLIKQVW
jgi:enoyl-[acyl-carrier-protein] reductase (NADH)